jgi:hypothetical protein
MIFFIANTNQVHEWSGERSECLRMPSYTGSSYCYSRCTSSVNWCNSVASCWTSCCYSLSWRHIEILVPWATGIQIRKWTKRVSRRACFFVWTFKSWFHHEYTGHKPSTANDCHCSKWVCYRLHVLVILTVLIGYSGKRCGDNCSTHGEIFQSPIHHTEAGFTAER